MYDYIILSFIPIHLIIFEDYALCVPLSEFCRTHKSTCPHLMKLDVLDSYMFFCSLLCRSTKICLTNLFVLAVTWCFASDCVWTWTAKKLCNIQAGKVACLSVQEKRCQKMQTCNSFNVYLYATLTLLRRPIRRADCGELVYIELPAHESLRTRFVHMWNLIS